MSRYWFISTKYRYNSKLVLFTFSLAVVVILMGAYTRLTDAGLSCPDWPHCYGFITAPHTSAQIQDAASKYPATPVNVKKAWTEMVHRYFAGTEGLLILALVTSILFIRKIHNLKSVIISTALVGLLALQVILGMLTVTEMLRPVIVLSHLLTGLSILSLLWWAYLDVHLRDNSFIKNTRPGQIPWIAFGLLIITLQIALGGWVSTNYAGLACIDFPYCNGKLIPDMQWHNLTGDLVSIHMLHRFGAVMSAIYLGLLSHVLLKNPALKSIAALALLLLCVQVTLGIFNILWLRPVWLALIHHGTGIFLLLTMITMLVKATYTEDKAHVFSTA